MSRNKKYVVQGPHRVHEVAPGETVSLDPDSLETARLLARGQLADASSRQQPADETPTQDVPDTGASESEE